ncbi:MAG TPA: iron chelate uptake ABC transporter family permease subunit [Bacteroidales bacterium]|nr:iron chelate uptake ABC transporter family permease subunit [Bacteroidales bacterium]
MNITDYLVLLMQDYTIRTISLGTAIIGIVCGILGSFAVLRKQSLLGDAISHASLPGIALAFLITGSKEPLVLFMGAVISGLIATLWIMGITTKTHLKSDTALGLILSVFFGFGMLLLTHIQKLPDANQAGLDKFLFGQAATLVVSDLYLLAAVGGISIIIVIIFYKEFKILAFDPQYAKTIGFNILALDIVLTSLIVVGIIIGLQTVGVVLMSAMLLAPAAAARQWTNRLGLMIILAAAFGAFSGVTGTAISSSMSNLSTGPVIVLIASALVFISFIFGFERGLLLKIFRQWKNRHYILKNELRTN